MKSLVLIECDLDAPVTGATCAVTAARRLGPMTLLASGPGARLAAERLARLAGVERVLVAEGAARAEALAPRVIAELRRLDCTQLIASSGAHGRGVLSRAAGLLSVMAVSDVVEIVDAITLIRPVHAGSALMTVESSDAVRVFSIRPSAYEAAPEDAQPAAPIETIDIAAAANSAVQIDRKRPSQEAGVELIGARVVVSGGRGVGSAEGFEQLRPLARALGAAVGASRAAVDAGYAAADSQVGQTGKSVAPDLYLALGISGAVQHWAGMKDSKTIVAVNKDAEAPIFQFADYGLVADLFDVLPTLTDAFGENAAAHANP